jgi:hypothetical protein
LAGYHFTHGIEFTFTSSSAVRSLAPGQRVLLVKNWGAFQAGYPGVTNVAGEFIGSLGNAGNRLTLVGPLEEPIFDVDYSDSWQPLADGFGFSLVVTDETTSPSDVDSPTRWRLSARLGGSPGTTDPALRPVPHVVVNELLTYPGHGAQDSLELFNPSAEPADVSGWFLTDDWRTPKKLRLADGLVVPPRGYLLLESPTALGANFAFSKLGEQVYLFSADSGGNLSGWAHGFSFGAAESGVSFGRYVNSVGAESFVPQLATSLGQPNVGPRIGPVVLNQVLFSGATDGASAPTSIEYVQLRNLSPQPISLCDSNRPALSWRLHGAVDFDFNTNTVLAANGTLTLVAFDPRKDLVALAHFRSRYGVDSVETLVGPWHGQLGEPPASIHLFKPGEFDLNAQPGETAHGVLVEEINVSAGAPWPTVGSGAALARRHLTGFADDPANWVVRPPSPGGIDSDGDGLSDAWEIANALNPFSAFGVDGSEGDPDVDGQTNLEEYLTGTRARDPDSRLKFDGLTRTDTEVALVFRAASGRRYTVEYRDSLTQGTWQLLRALIAPANGGILSLTDTPATSQRFYRLRSP